MSEQAEATLFDFIVHSSPEFVKELLSDAETCRTFTRLLSPLAQTYLYRFLLFKEPIEYRYIEQWGTPGTEVAHQSALRQLQECHVLQAVRLQSGFYACTIVPEFRDILLYPKIETDNSTDSFSSASIQIEEEIIDTCSQNCLERILLWMLKPSTKIDPEIRQLLGTSGLIDFNSEMTKEGHQFVLKDSRSQIWFIVRHYLEQSVDKIVALRFLLKLGCLQFSHGYSINDLSQVQIDLLQPFSHLGLVATHSMNPAIAKGYCFPTRVVLNFFGRAELFQSEGWMLIDTNFKVTAYTSSPLYIALLEKFALITYEMPGFVSAYISPQSFHRALQSGTTMNDILSFMKASISTNLGSGTIPHNVAHQMGVWERQRDRIVTTPRCILRKCYTIEEAAKLQRAAEKINIWCQCLKSTSLYGFITLQEDENQLRDAIAIEDSFEASRMQQQPAEDDYDESSHIFSSMQY